MVGVAHPTKLIHTAAHKKISYTLQAFRKYTLAKLSKKMYVLLARKFLFFKASKIIPQNDNQNISTKF